MKLRFALPMICALTCAGLAFGTSRAAAQADVPFTVQLEETSSTIAPGGVHLFNLTVTNTSSQNLTIRVARTANGLPGEDWSSSICFGGLCYDASTSTPEPTTVKPGASTSCELTISGGMDVGKTATVTLRFTAGFDTKNYVDKTLSATTSDASGVPYVAGALALPPAFPNPASSYALLPVPAESGAKAASLALYNVRGEQVAELSGDLRKAMESGASTVRVDLAGLPAGSYLYRMIVDGREVTRTLNIVR
jgi:hypothetical protein